jgi:4-hydroxy-2-oxoglutarate aldolase
MSNQLFGIYAPITTPFDNEEVNLDILGENVSKYSNSPLAGYFVLGSNGEGKSLSEKEKIEIIKTVIEKKDPGQLVICGVGYESTKLTREFTKIAADLGSDVISVLTPYYFRKYMSDEALLRYFINIADNSPIPIMVYNASSFTNITISISLFKLLIEHPNIIGMKDSSQGNIFLYLEYSSDKFVILSGTTNYLLPSLLFGASGGIVSLANYLPQQCFELYQAVLINNMDKAKSLHQKLLRINRIVSGSYGVAGVKYAMDLVGYYGGIPRLPLLPLDENDKVTIKKSITDFNLSS